MRRAECLELAAVSAGGLAKRFGLAGAAFTALAGTTAAGLWHQFFRRPLPRVKGSLRLNGLEQAVEIGRDRWGVPHIRAKTRHDLWFAEGFCHGQDRLWQLDLYRRIGSGRLAEIAGRPGLQTDRFMRTLGLRRAAEREVAELQPELRSALDAYCAGVNAAAADRPLPAEFQLLRIGFEEFVPADSLLLAKLLSFGLSTNWERELLRAEMARELGADLAARLDPGYPRGNPVILTPGEAWTGDGLGLAEQIAVVRDSIGLAVEASGSNNWAVAGTRSATGGPLLAGDPHLPPSMPGITYQVGLYLEDRFCRGAALPGMPGVFMGQNNDLAWSFTNVMADVMDLFIERIDGDTYEFEGESRPLELIEEEIVVKRRAEPERLVVRETHHGPIVNEALRADDAEPLALRFMALDFPGLSPASLGGSRLHERRRPGAGGRRARAPRVQPGLGRPARLDRLQDGRPPSGSPRRLPRPPEARLDGRARVGGLGSLRGDARADRPGPGLRGHGQQPGRPRGLPAPHHQRLPGRLPGAPHRAADHGPGGARSGELRGDADGHALASGAGDRSPACPAAPARPAGAGGDRAAALLGRADEPRVDRGHHLPGVHAAAGARGRPGGDRRPRPGGALARPRRQRVHRPCHLALALAVAPARPLG